MAIICSSLDWGTNVSYEIGLVSLDVVKPFVVPRIGELLCLMG